MVGICEDRDVRSGLVELCLTDAGCCSSFIFVRHMGPRCLMPLMKLLTGLQPRRPKAINSRDGEPSREAITADSILDLERKIKL